MRCWGLTKPIHRLKRCKIEFRNRKYPFCKKHRFQPIIFLFTISTVIGLYAGIFQDLIKPTFIYDGKKLSDREIEVIAKRIAEAEMKLEPFLTDDIWKAYLTLQKVLSEGDLGKSNPKLAAKAHRLMAGVYFAAFMIVGPPMPGLPEHMVVIHNAIKSLGQGGWKKAKNHIEESLRLDSKQPDASKLREAVMVFEACVIAGEISLDQFSKLWDLLIPPDRKFPKSEVIKTIKRGPEIRKQLLK